MAEPHSNRRLSPLVASLLGFHRRESQRRLELLSLLGKGTVDPELLSRGVIHS